MKQALVVQPTMFMQMSHQALIYVLEPAFTSPHNTVVTLLCEVLEKLYGEFYVNKSDQPPNIPAQVSVRAPTHFLPYQLLSLCAPNLQASVNGQESTSLNCPR
jgi:hypothetical protein